MMVLEVFSFTFASLLFFFFFTMNVFFLSCKQILFALPFSTNFIKDMAYQLGFLDNC